MAIYTNQASLERRSEGSPECIIVIYHSSERMIFKENQSKPSMVHLRNMEDTL